MVELKFQSSGDLIVLICQDHCTRVFGGKFSRWILRWRKSIERGKYDFFTCTITHLSLLHIEWEKQEHNRTFRTYFNICKSKKSLSCFPEKQLPLDSEGGQKRPLISKILTSVVTVLTGLVSPHCGWRIKSISPQWALRKLWQAGQQLIKIIS